MDSTSRSELVGLVAAYRAEIRPLLRTVSRCRRISSREYLITLPCDDAVVVVSGAGVRRATEAAREISAKYRLASLWSVGFAGGLTAAATPGTVVLASDVVNSATGKRYTCSAEIVGKESIPRGAIITVARVLAGRSDKSSLSSSWPGVAAEMEAAAVAQVAEDCGLAFGALKAITDGPDDEFAIDFQRCLTENGGLSTFRIVRESLRSLAQFGSLLRLARNSRTAAKALATVLTSLHR